jgi:hypothetical protein
MMFPGMIASAMNSMGSQPAVQQPAPGASAPSGLDFSQLKPKSHVGDVGALVTQLAQQSGWSIESQDANGLVLVVSLGPTRRQRVNIELNQKDSEGNALIAIWSTCGPMNPSSATTLLRYNDQLVHGAFALRRLGDSEHVVLRTSLLADTTDALELSRSVSAIAWQADQVEMQLSGADSF